MSLRGRSVRKGIRRRDPCVGVPAQTCTDRSSGEYTLCKTHAERKGGRVAIVDRRWSALPVPYAMEFPDRARKERYFDPDFYQMEVDLLWPRVWQMACRLEEIPQAERLRRV
jgi:hypothetical protein